MSERISKNLKFYRVFLIVMVIVVFGLLAFSIYYYLQEEENNDPQVYDNFIQQIDSIESLEWWKLERTDSKYIDSWRLSVSIESGTTLFFDESDSLEDALNQLNEALEYLEK